MTRAFAIVGRKASSSPTFSLDDFPGTSGRLDVLCRCVRAALLTSHGIRRDARVYLVLLGDPGKPRTICIDGAEAKFVRPDERSLGTLLKKTLASAVDANASGFVPARPGISIARGGLEVVLAHAAGATAVVLDERGEDVRAAPVLPSGDVLLVLGDHLGLDEAARALLAGARTVSVGPVSLHSDDVVAVVSNELDRAEADGRARP